MRYSLSFNDPYGRTRLSGRKALLFCAYNGFSIPHDTVGAILYGELLQGLAGVSFSDEVSDVMTVSMVSYVEDADWLLAAIRSMGYGDIADEFESIDGQVTAFVADMKARGDWNEESLREKILSLIPEKFVQPMLR